MMAIDEIDWSVLEDAYGPAVNVPSQVRALSSPDVDKAFHGLNELIAGLMHQGPPSYSATSPAVPFLVDAVAQAAPQVKSSIAHFLGVIAGLDDTPRLVRGPWAYRNASEEDDGLDDLATLPAVLAVRAARGAFAGWLDDAEPTLRATAAFLLGGLDVGAGDVLEARLTVETEPAVRATLVIALAEFGRTVEVAPTSALEAGCLAALRALKDHVRDGDIASIELLAARRLRSDAYVPYYRDELWILACKALRTLARTRSREVFIAARRAVVQRLAHGEHPVGAPDQTIPELADPHSARQFVSPNQRRQAALDELASILTLIAFGPRAWDPRSLRHEVLRLGAEHGIVVPVRGTRS
jgi:hypothetical protein